MVLLFRQKDRMCGFLPLFHSFGFTCCMWCPLITGFPTHFHPNPLDAAGIAEAVRTHRLTVLLATPTFLLSYYRRARPEDFASLRLVVTGAEKLRLRVADAFREKFGIEPLEGYGCTELSPVVAANLPDVTAGGVRQIGTKRGSVGHPIPGVAVRIVDPETGVPRAVGEPGLLLVKGPNVMRGYLGDSGKTAEVIADGWYNTGDIAKVDEDGFVFLTDRLARFSKIGGEMVSHLVVEEEYLREFSHTEVVLAVTSVPDDRRGERLVVLYTDSAGGPERLHPIIEKSPVPNLWKPGPNDYYRLNAMPLTGSGKLDLSALRRLAVEIIEKLGQKKQEEGSP
jgi:acyl-[acyl-carrier-protein]-phospholipid O-acyltransferase/long-chain-fatty-acid--[acyl-carrier-protein] ligase